MDDRLSRRKLLGLLTSSSAVAVAGCQDDNTDRETDTKSQIPSGTEVDTPQLDTSSPTETASETPSPTNTPSPTAEPDHGIAKLAFIDPENAMSGDIAYKDESEAELERHEVPHTLQMTAQEIEETYTDELYKQFPELDKETLE